jgi:opacity protein-like surface antigen
VSRRLIGLVALALAGPGRLARAEPPAAPADPGTQGIGAEVGLASGSHLTPGGLKIAGHFLYRLSADDWFDGTASFTFGGGAARCFLDRDGSYVCDHGLLDGKAGEIVAAVRRQFDAQGQFRPYARAGVGVGVARFSDDDVTGLTLALHGGGGVRARVQDVLAVVIDADVMAGLGVFGHAIGGASQLGFSIMAGVEFDLE